LTGAPVFVTVEDCEALLMATRRSSRRFSLVSSTKWKMFVDSRFFYFLFLCFHSAQLARMIVARPEGYGRIEALSDHRIIRANYEVS